MSGLAEQVAQTAERAVAMGAERGGGALDYSAASLAVVEEMLAEIASFWDDLAAKERGIISQDFGCYLLEVARHEFGGEYQWFEDREQPVLVVERPDCQVALMAWDKIRGRASGDEADNIPFFYDGFAQAASAAKPGTNSLFV
ncbi:hypothetical protein [Blastopirellula marina]|uniref:Uncharacterized protein n=1 Tax=Blastopirellula marina TaxID=124 RepID=A0A2S8GS12_9BACT|nr:hypothetical protein [Blastopirellula marina]PQO47218.1 hypothetical protein C5Y93_04040 [Blastopirellula marina]